jgi:hypothetical protein
MCGPGHRRGWGLEEDGPGPGAAICGPPIWETKGRQCRSLDGRGKEEASAWLHRATCEDA